MKRTKTFFKLMHKADELLENIEMGLLTKAEALRRIRAARADFLDHYEEGSDEFTELVYILIDADYLAQNL